MNRLASIVTAQLRDVCVTMDGMVKIAPTVSEAQTLSFDPCTMPGKFRRQGGLNRFSKMCEIFMYVFHSQP